MIYLKKDNEIQTAFIPKNGSYEGKLSYKEGYKEGYVDGMEEGKNNPYTTKGVFVENGLQKHIAWGFNVERNYPVSWMDDDNILEISFYPLREGGLITSDRAYFDFVLEGGKLIARVDDFEVSVVCELFKWHTLKMQGNGFWLDKKYYEYPKSTSYQGTMHIGRSWRDGRYYGGYISYIYATEDEGVEMYYYYDKNDGQIKRLNKRNGIWKHENQMWGTFPPIEDTPPMESVMIDVPQEGGNCPELTELNVSENGRYEGAYNVVNVDVPDVNGSYDEGYNNGYNDGKAEGGSCNIEETRWAEPTPADVDGSGYLVYHKSEGYDGMDRVALNMNGYNALKYNEGYEAGKAEGGSCNLGELDVEWSSGWTENRFYAFNDGYDGYSAVSIYVGNALNEKYNEGYEAGKAEGGSCNLTELNIEWQSDWNENDYYADKQGYDGYSYVHIDATTALKEKYDEGYNFAINNDAVLIPSKVEKKFNTLALRTENIHDSDIILDRTKLRGFYDESAEDYFIAYTQNKNGVVICEHGEFSKPSVTTIENGGLNWNTIEYFYSYTITTFGENMTRDMGSNVRQIHLDSPIMNTDGADIIFRSGCFATSNLLNKIVFYQPLKVAVYDNAFEGISSYGEVIVVGEDNAENRAKYDTLMAQLGSEWTLTFVDEYNE